MSPLALLFSVLFLSTAAPLLTHAQSQEQVLDSDGDPLQTSIEYYLQATRLDSQDGPGSYVIFNKYDNKKPCPRYVEVDLSHERKDPVRISDSPVVVGSPHRLSFPIANDICDFSGELPISASKDISSPNGNNYIVAGEPTSAKMWILFEEDTSEELSYRMQVCRDPNQPSTCSQVGWIAEEDRVFLVEDGETFAFKFVKAQSSRRSRSHIRKYSSA